MGRSSELRVAVQRSLDVLEALETLAQHDDPQQGDQQQEARICTGSR